MHRLQPILVAVEMPGVQFSLSSSGTDTGGQPPHRRAASHQSLQSQHVFQASHSHTQTDRNSLAAEEERESSSRVGLSDGEETWNSGTGRSSCFSISPCVRVSRLSSPALSISHTLTHMHTRAAAGVVTPTHPDTPPFSSSASTHMTTLMPLMNN